MSGRTDGALAELKQRATGWRAQTLRLYEDRVVLEVEGIVERYRLPFYLPALKEEADEILWLPVRAFLLGAVAAAAGALLAALGARALDPAAGAGLIALGGGTLAWTALRVRRIHVFSYKAFPSADGVRVRYVPQLFLFPHLPSVDEVRRFEDLLRGVRERQVEKGRMEQEEGIPFARELERFARLHSEKIVTEEEFAQVKAKLLNIRPRRIGF